MIMWWFLGNTLGVWTDTARNTTGKQLLVSHKGWHSGSAYERWTPSDWHKVISPCATPGCLPMIVLGFFRSYLCTSGGCDRSPKILALLSLAGAFFRFMKMSHPMFPCERKFESSDDEVSPKSWDTQPLQHPAIQTCSISQGQPNCCPQRMEVHGSPILNKLLPVQALRWTTSIRP